MDLNCKFCIHIDECQIYQDFEEVMLKHRVYLDVTKRDHFLQALSKYCLRYILKEKG